MPQERYQKLGNDIQIYKYNEQFQDKDKQLKDQVLYSYNLELGREIAQTQLDSITIFETDAHQQAQAAGEGRQH